VEYKCQLLNADISTVKTAYERTVENFLQLQSGGKLVSNIPQRVSVCACVWSVRVSVCDT